MPRCNKVKKELGEISSNVCACAFSAKSVHYLKRYVLPTSGLGAKCGQPCANSTPPLNRRRISVKVLLICYRFLERCNAQTFKIAHKLTRGFRHWATCTAPSKCAMDEGSALADQRTLRLLAACRLNSHKPNGNKRWLNDRISCSLLPINNVLIG